MSEVKRAKASLIWEFLGQADIISWTFKAAVMGVSARRQPRELLPMIAKP